MRTTAVSTSTSDAIWFIDGRVRVHVAGDDTGGRLALLEMEAPRGHMPPLHVHHGEDETFVVLEGELTLYVGPEVHRLYEGDVALAPLGIPHTFRVETETARWVVSTSPAGFERFVEEVGEPAGGPGLPPEPVLPGPERFAEICAAFEIELLGPPGTLPS
jgi:quercetin dioxygenase-like cupin family protein